MNNSATTPYVSTFSGNRFYPLEPRIDRVAIEVLRPEHKAAEFEARSAD